MPERTAAHEPAAVRAAARATSVAFVASGFAFTSWASRIPQVRDRLELSPSDLGLVLLGIAVGSLIALPLAGVAVQRLGSRRTVAITSVLLAVALAVIATGYLAGVVPLLVGLFLLGLANGAWDVGMNVQGAIVERHLGRAIMPRFHAGYSAGTVVGALVGVLVVAAGVPVTAHLLVAAAVVALVVPIAVRGFVPDVDVDPDAPSAQPVGSAAERWREPRTLLVGVVVLAFALSEGAAQDWISVALIDGYDAPAAIGTLGFATFLAAMTAVRWFGTGLLDRYGRVAVLRGTAAVAVGGLLLFVLAPVTPLAVVGALLWGAGSALGFPVGMSAAADQPEAAAPRVSVVASIGYTAFLGGPPLIGFLGEQITVLRALLVAAALLALATAATGALRPLPARAPTDLTS